MALDIEKALSTARAAVEAAAAASLRHFRQPLAVEVKEDRSPVTRADKEADAAVIATIRRAFPQHALLTEESGEMAGTPGTRWIVDPLDGTRDFIRGSAFWGPLVACEHEGEVVAGAMALPALGEVYWAARGAGAWCNGARLAVSQVAEWPRATANVGQLRKLTQEPWRAPVLELLQTCESARSYGGLAALSTLLWGRTDAWLEVGVHIWDIAPMKVLVEEAGGTFTDLVGRPTIESGNAVATNGRLHRHVLQRLADRAGRSDSSPQME